MFVTLKVMIATKLPAIDKKDQLEQVVTILRQAHTYDEAAAELTALALGYLEGQELWKVRFDSLRSMQAFFDPEGDWDKASERHKIIHDRQPQARKAIEKAGDRDSRRIPLIIYYSLLAV